MRWLYTISPKSLLLILVAFIGNAQILGIDLVSFLLVPLFFISIPKDGTLKRHTLLPFCLFTILMMLLITQTILSDIPIQNYYLWPIKAFFIAMIIAFSDELNWPIGNSMMLFAGCIALIAIGTVIDGRLYSVFGPNMLYRFFGLLLFLSAGLLINSNHTKKILAVTFLGFATFGSILTGSVGAFAIILAVCLFVVTKMPKSFSIALGCLSIICVLTVSFYADRLAIMTSSLTVYNRILYKILNIEANTRLNGWNEILNKEISFLGFDYYDFSGIWELGYQYPHNIAIELYAFYGITGILTLLILLLGTFKTLKQSITNNFIAISFIVILIGSLFSGELSDNYAVVGMSAGILLRSKFPIRPLST
ncbi:hypothetical protein [Kordiimonas laminariae]|uniref:hypothetical protein n=1 Tax=Kordiimonas laminariae TaxID=2917717 RepID=UPI001FF12A7E|nr:hypothetical protein [Kordiimonas laminariae]MCK0070288.1 hypothetical protein [Kordiimonas laminariae]